MLSKDLLFSLTIASNLLFTISVKEMELSDGILQRSKRQLLWPNSTLLQFNAGFGFPSAAKSINVNYAFQANFQLPWNRTQIPVDIFGANTGYVGTARRKREARGIKDDKNGDYQDDAKLYHFYKNVESILDGSRYFDAVASTMIASCLENASGWKINTHKTTWTPQNLVILFGHNGKSCVLQTLCQLGAEPLHSDDEEDLLHEMAMFVLNPKNDGTSNLSESDEAYPYIKAYTDGEQHQDCTKLYQGCSLSFIDVFTKLHDLAG